MEHPVPQNVTAFEFHLIGDMTLKQFIYLASGLGIAYFVFIFLYPVSPLIFLPIIVIASLIGAAFAFVPIADRPLDHWAHAFFKAIYTPTIGKWNPPQEIKDNKSLFDPFTKNRLYLYLSASGLAPNMPEPEQSPISPAISYNQNEVNQFRQIKKPLPAQKSITPLSSPVNQLTKVVIPSPQPELPSSRELAEVVELANQAQQIRSKLVDLENRIEQIKSSPMPATAYSQDLQQLFGNIQNLVKETDQITPQITAPSTTQNPNTANKKPEVRVVETSRPQPAQPLLTSLPNVINGIVTDLAGNYLEGVIVIIHNLDGLPVRALKTNKIGQFAGATPLPSGVFNISLEKEGLRFDALQITLVGEVIAPIKISTKKETN